MIARVLAVPNPLLDLKLSSTELPNSLGETGLWVGVGRGGGREGSSWLILTTGSEAAPLPRGSVTAGLHTAGESLTLYENLLSDMPI